MNVLITGGTGFIGSRLALRLIKDGHQVTVLGQMNNEAETGNTNMLKNSGAIIAVASVTDRDQLDAHLQGVDVVYHLAAAQHEANVPDQYFRDINVKGTENMLEASIKANVKRFVHASTIGVYGSSMEGEISEETRTQPDNIYGITKLEGEKLVLSYQDRLPVSVIRVSETYGPGDRRLLKLFSGVKKRMFFVIGDGKNLHHLIYIDDLIDGFLMAATSEAALGQMFVLAGKEPVTTEDMIKIVADVIDVKPLPFRAPLWPFIMVADILEMTLRPFGIQPPLHRRRMDFFKKSFAFSQEKSSKVLGFEPSHTFKEGAAKTASWYSEMNLL